MAPNEPRNLPSNQPAPSTENKSSLNSQGKAWYTENVTDIPPEARELLEQYSKIPPKERDKAFTLGTYACIGQLRFLNASLPSHPSYPAILSLLRRGASYLDAGCCFAQELRYLVHAGIPSTQLYGFDIEPKFFEYGYDLFRDRKTLQAIFVPGDILAESNSKEGSELDKLVGQMDVVFANSFLHVWDWHDMIVATKRLVSFTKANKGSMVVGRQLGSVNAISHAMPTKGGSNWRHNVQSMERFWKQVGEETGSEWKVEAALDDGAELKENKGHTWSEPGMRMISWSAVRL